MATALTRSYPYDAQSASEDAWREIFTAAWGNGVVAGVGDEMFVSPGVGRAVSVGTGNCFVVGAFGASDTDVSLATSSNPGANDRLDRVVLRNHTTNNLIELDILQGSPAATPVLPALTQNTSIWELLVADLYLPHGYTAFTSGQIGNMRRLLSPGSTVSYDDAEARAAHITAPAEGLRSYLRDTNGLYVHDGTAWQLTGGNAPHVIAANAVAQTFTGGVTTALRFSSLVRDTHNAFNLTSGFLTAPETGVYDVKFSTVHPDTDNVYVVHQIAWAGNIYSLSRFNPLALGGGTGETVALTSSFSVFVTAGQTITPAAVFTITRTGVTVANALSITWVHA